MRPDRLAQALAAALAIVVLQGCAAVMASNEPQRNGLIGQVQVGMTEGEVRAILGPPNETMAFPRTQTVAWDYRYSDTWGFLAMFSVTFGPDGRVASTFSRRLNDGRSSSGLN